jgi:hypothetical protein
MIYVNWGEYTVHGKESASKGFLCATLNIENYGIMSQVIWK